MSVVFVRARLKLFLPQQFTVARNHFYEGAHTWFIACHIARKWKAQMVMHWPISVAVLLSAPISASFIGTAIDRVPQGEAIAWCRSKCISCKRELAPRDLIPIASYLMLFGHCRFCKTSIPQRYFAEELFALLASLASLAIIGTTNFIFSLPLAWLLFALAVC